jgi:predicted dehydrogenase
MKDVIKVGYIGLGARGYSMIKHCFGKMNDVEVVYICDLYDDRIEKTLEFFRDNQLPIPKVTKDYREVIADESVDAVVNLTGWNGHVDITLASLLAGKYTAVEVGCAYTVQECWDLINAHEKTGAPLMMLENCCYGRREMAALRMAREGLFGELVHAVGS